MDDETAFRRRGRRRRGEEEEVRRKRRGSRRRRVNRTCSRFIHSLDMHVGMHIIPLIVIEILLESGFRECFRFKNG